MNLSANRFSTKRGTNPEGPEANFGLASWPMSKSFKWLPIAPQSLGANFSEEASLQELTVVGKGAERQNASASECYQVSAGADQN
jgi:hypothetical protein